MTNPQQEQAQRERLRRLAERVTDEQLATPLGEHWTVSVALAHMAFWDRRVVAQLAKWERDGRGPEPGDTIDSEVINDASLAQWRALARRAALQEVLEAAEACDHAVATADARLIDAVIRQQGPFTLPRAVHRAEHLDQIERAIGS
ncbi:MAG: maleylpyruvate isomerase N-terminal domain-containing protein [Chloroflexi bacterium]|nr:maleylpyruvate isomerase N-terminal domain-containing protein [Chloroflexota bacterium]